jgi:hypothetical protein
LLAAAVHLARLNPATMSFSPHPEATSFVAASTAEFPEPGDMVLGVELRGEAKAFPLRLLTYHHIVNAEVGGVVVAATY